MSRLIPSKRLPTPHDRVDIERVQLESEATSSGSLGSDQCSAAAKKTIEHDIAASSGIHDCIRYHSDRFYSRVEAQQVALVAGSRKRTRAGIGPEVAPVSAVRTKHYVIAVSLAPMLEDEDEFVLATIQRAHAGVVFGPNAEIFELRVDGSTCTQKLLHVAPIHT